MKKILRCSILLVAILFVFPVNSIRADVKESNPCYEMQYWMPAYREPEGIVGMYDTLRKEVIEKGYDHASITFPDDEQIYVDFDYKFLMVNGVLIQNAEIITQNGITLVPIRTISEALSAEAIWSESAKEITVKKGTTEIIVTVGSKNANVNGKNQSIDKEVTIINNRTYVSLRFIAENLGSKVGYFDKAPFMLFPVVWVETNDSANLKSLSKEQALKKAKDTFLTDLEEKIKRYGGDWDYVYDIIDSLRCKREFSRFWIIENSHGYEEMLVDKYTGAVFNFRTAGGEYNTGFWFEKFNVGFYMAG